MFFADTMAEVGKFMDSGGMVLWAIVVLGYFFPHLNWPGVMVLKAREWPGPHRV